ncbi:DEP domain-containing protein 1A-like isoform X1 [Terrapene carolina triunguis]|uniref:DEP domain-containing protein 1A-like isoform X1 n=1 Tax=Terrapene triunguis TaxID=2587831 RepID=UPI000E773C06|nr:DEP domain-containing protein 1A-like isoform X1 [Terrapene carolina triunguis]
MESRLVTAGPYRATKLWNEVTKYFRAGMPLRKHRQRFRKHGNCFSAVEAVDWLHELLRNNRNFGPEVSRQQTVQLLRKFLKNHVIEDIKGRWGSENLDDNNDLFRFPSTSPVKTLQRRSLLKENTENIPKEEGSLFKLPHFSRRTPKKHELLDTLENIENTKSEIMEEDKENLHRKKISQEDIEEIWRNIILIHLQTILGLPSLEEVLHSAQVIPQYVMYNMSNTSKHGVVVLQNKSEDLPHWVLSAMKCLAYWPRSNDMSQPTYIGFERDVFRTVADYFLNLPEPLLTFEYYELFVNILVVCGYITIPNRPSGKHCIQDEACDPQPSKTLHLNSFKSTECLLLSLLRKETEKQEEESESSGNISQNERTLQKECAKKLQHYNLACKRASAHDLRGGSCKNLSGLRNEQALSLKLRARCYSLEQIAATTSSFCNEMGSNSLYQSDINIISGKNKENPLLHSGYKAELLLDLGSDSTGQKELCGSRRVSASTVHDQELCNGNRKSKQLCTSQSLLGSSKSRNCSGINTPVAEITVKPYAIVHLGQRKSSTTSVVTIVENEPRDSDITVNKRLCKSAVELSENSFTPASFMLTGTQNLLRPHLERVAIEALQICCLLLPPPNRRKLQLLMRMISRISQNVDMPRLHDAMGTRSLMIQTFSRCVLCCAEEVDLDELLATRLVSFLMDHQQDIFKVPTYLQVAVQDHIESLKTAQFQYPGEEISAILPTYSYCKRITPQEFDEQKFSTSQAAVAELLENIIRDKSLSLKDKKKKLKRFQKEYPLIYQNRFPTTESEAILFENKPTIKQPMLSLKKPKFRSVRYY